MSKLVNIDLLRARLVTKWPAQKLVELQDTPHWQFIQGNELPYQTYLEGANQPEHTVDKFALLIDTFSPDWVGSIKCIEKDGLYLISDGFHRACIMLALGYKKINIFTNHVN